MSSGAAAAGDAKKRKKNFYHGKQAGGKRGKYSNQLDSASGPGFLITFNPHQERRATLIAYSLLNEAADRLYGPAEKPAEEKDGKTAKEDDIEAELKSLREENFRFNKLRTEIPSIIFISTKLPKPQDICTNMFENLPATVQHIVRFLPVAATCKTQPECVTKRVLEILGEHYPVVLSKITFLVQLKARHNNEYNSSDARRAFCLELAQKIQEWNSDFVPDLKEPELVINIDILQKVGCISLLPHFLRFKKYNPEQFNTGPPPKTEEATAEAKATDNGEPEKKEEATEIKDSTSEEKPGEDSDKKENAAV